MSYLKHAGIACAFAVLVVASGAARAQSNGDVLTYKGPDRQERLIEGAKKEGKLVFYSAMIVNQALRDRYRLVMEIPIGPRVRQLYKLQPIELARRD